jgi:hypothetical protein
MGNPPDILLSVVIGKAQVGAYAAANLITIQKHISYANAIEHPA